MTGTAVTKILADRLTDLIKDCGEEHRKIANDCGLRSHGSLSKYASDGAEPGINALVKLADYFGVSIDYLAGRTDKKSAKVNLQGAVNFTGLSEDAAIRLREMYSRLTAQWVLPGYERMNALNSISWFITQNEFWEIMVALLSARHADDMLTIEGGEMPPVAEFNLVDNCATLYGRAVGNYYMQHAKDLFAGLVEKLRGLSNDECPIHPSQLKLDDEKGAESNAED